MRSKVGDKQHGLRSYMGGATRMKERQGRSNEEKGAKSRKEQLRWINELGATMR